MSRRQNAGLLPPEDYDVDPLPQGTLRSGPVEEQRAIGNMMPGMFNMVEGYFGGYNLNREYPNYRMNPRLNNIHLSVRRTAAQLFARDIANNPLQTLDIERSFGSRFDQRIPRLGPERALLPGQAGYDSTESELSDLEDDNVLPLRQMSGVSAMSSDSDDL